MPRRPPRRPLPALAVRPTPPAAPSALSATAVSASQINLNWQDNSGNESGFYVQRGTTSAGPWSQIAAVGVNVRTYSNTGLTAGTTYYFAVRAYDTGSNLSAYSTESVATLLDTVAPANVGNTATAAKSGGNVALAWTAVTLNASGGTCETVNGYRVYRGTTPNFTPGAALSSPPGTTFTDTTAGADAYYLISAVDAAGNESIKN